MISMSENDELSEFVRPSLSVQSQQQQEEGEVVCWIVNNSPFIFIGKNLFR